MAKRKTPKVKNLKPTSITEEQLNAIKSIVSPISKIQTELGRIEPQKHIMLHQITKLQESLQEEQTALEKQYGKVNVNINDGSITYPQDEQADS